MYVTDAHNIREKVSPELINNRCRHVALDKDRRSLPAEQKMCHCFSSTQKVHLLSYSPVFIVLTLFFPLLPWICYSYGNCRPLWMASGPHRRVVSEPFITHSLQAHRQITQVAHTLTLSPSLSAPIVILLPHFWVLDALHVIETATQLFVVFVYIRPKLHSRHSRRYVTLDASAGRKSTLIRFVACVSLS